jgi:hypothetical protein
LPFGKMEERTPEIRLDLKVREAKIHLQGSTVVNFCFSERVCNSKPNICWSRTTLNYRMVVERYPNLKEEVDNLIPEVKSPLYLMENLSGGQLPPVLWCWPCRQSVSTK